MRIETDIDYYPTPEELAEHMWESMDSEEMAEMLFQLCKIRKNQVADFDMEMRYVAEEVSYMESDTFRAGYGKAILDMLKEFIEIIEEEMSNE